MITDEMKMILKEAEYYPDIFLVVPRKTTKASVMRDSVSFEIRNDHSLNTSRLNYRQAAQ
jgi:hypothetical protein